MQNSQAWRPSKFVLGKNGYEASQNPDEVHLGSRFIVNLQARVCEKLIKEHAFGRLLDLGCGKVPLYEVYKNYISDNVCVDWPQTLHKSSHLDYEMNLNNEIPLPSEHFDTILATDVLEHIANPDLLWKEIARLLRQKGKIIITVPFFYWIHEEPHDYYRFSEYQLKSFCERNQLHILLLEPYGGTPEIFLDLLAKHLAFSSFLSQVHFWGSQFLMSLKLSRKLSQKTARRFPLGYELVAQKG